VDFVEAAEDERNVRKILPQEDLDQLFEVIILIQPFFIFARF
jgi:hypothetical protein